MPGAEEEVVKEVHRALMALRQHVQQAMSQSGIQTLHALVCRAAGATSRVMEEAMNVVIAKASHSKEALRNGSSSS